MFRFRLQVYVGIVRGLWVSFLGIILGLFVISRKTEVLHLDINPNVAPA